MAHIWIKAGDKAGEDRESERAKMLLQEQREQHAAEMRDAMDARSLAMGARDLRHVEWPTVEHYGHDHGKQVSQLALHLAQTLRDNGDHVAFTQNDLHVIKAAGYFHDLGRTLPWTEEDAGHRERGAELAAKAMALDSENWVPAHLRDEVCRVIVQHRVTLDGPLPTDPRMIVLWDAECLEAARFAPNTPEGLVVMGKKFARLVTPWAKDQSIQRRWKEHRGWR